MWIQAMGALLTRLLAAVSRMQAAGSELSVTGLFKRKEPPLR